MIYNFDALEGEVIPNFKGGEKYAIAKFAGDDKVKILHGVLEPGCSIGMHEHINESEIVYCIAGQATVYMDGKTEILKPGMCHYCPDGHKHGMKNEGTKNFEMFAVVPKHNI